jgi:hypothetical protein
MPHLDLFITEDSHKHTFNDNPPAKILPREYFLGVSLSACRIIIDLNIP